MAGRRPDRHPPGAGVQRRLRLEDRTVTHWGRATENTTRRDTGGQIRKTGLRPEEKPGAREEHRRDRTRDQEEDLRKEDGIDRLF